ncbi:hypothetical protein JCM3765_005215 [Sporobolomyces pararoseus]
MSFNRLPHEILQLIVDTCAEADRAYHDRIGEQEIKREEQGTTGQWKGRSCLAVSLVNRTLRSMTLKHIFKTLPIAKADDLFFRTCMIGSTTANCLTNIDFGDDLVGVQYSTSTLLRLVSETLPRLSNIRTIKGLKSYHLSAICPGGDLADFSKRQLQTRNAFLELAHKVEDWDLEVEAEEFETIINVNPSKIKRLNLSSPDLFSSDSRFPSILAKLPSLDTLKLHHQDMETFDPIPIGHLDESFFEIPYQFANTLRSLELHFSGDWNDYDQTVTIDLKFASHFPLLENLVVNANARSPWETSGKNTFDFPRLRYLEIKGLAIECIDYVFIDLKAPKIEEIHFNCLESSFYKSHQAKDQLVEPLERFEPTLCKVKISNSLDPLDSLLPAIFAKFLPSVTLELDSPTLLALDPISLDEYREKSLPKKNWRPPPAIPLSAADPFYEETNELLNWARSKAELWKDEDLKMGKELRKALQLVKDMKEWLEE